MRKILKGISLFAITIIVGCLFINCVNAETRSGSVHSSVTTNVTTTTKSTDKSSDFADIGQLIIKRSGNEVTEYFGEGLPFYRHAESGTGLPFYCLDANLNGYGTLVAKRFLLGDVEPNVYSYDLAVMHVMLSDASYEIKSLVIRTLTATWNHGRSNTYPGIDAGTLALMKAYYGLALEWIEEDSGIEASYNVILNSFSSGIISSKSDLQSKSGGYTFNQAMTNRAQARQLYAEALEIAAEYLQSDGQPKVEVENGADWSTFRTEEASYGEYHNYQITRVFTLSNFTNDGEASFVIDSLEYDLPLEELGVIDQPRFESIKINGTEYIDSFGGPGSYGAIGQNLLEPLNSSQSITDEVVIEVTIEFFGAANVPEELQSLYGNLNCGTQPMDWTLNYTYNDTNINGYFGDYLGIVWEATRNDGQSQHQRFVSVEPLEDTGEEEEGIKGTITGSVELMDACSCDDLIDACIASNDINSTECDELFAANCGECAELQVQCEFEGPGSEPCQQYEEVCTATCETTVDMFECCDADNNMLIISTEDNHPVNITGPEDVKACFVNQVDAQVEEHGNASSIPGIKDEEENSYTQQQNKYCLVSCKEDYAMQMPTAKLVNAGRYFTFSAAVQGTKTCYTNTIDRELYNEDIAKAQRAMFDAYNNYRKWYELFHNSEITAPEESYDVSCHCSASGCSAICEQEQYSPNWVVKASVDDWVFYEVNSDSEKATGLVEYDQDDNPVSTTYQYEALRETGSGECSGCVPRGEGEGCDPCGDSYTTYSDYVVHTEAQLMSWLEGQMTTALGTLNNAIQAFYDTITAYNSCSNWESEINYEPDVYYDYAEDYLADYYENRGEMIESLNDKGSSNWICNSNVSTSGSYTQATIDDLEYNICSLDETSSVRNTEINYTICDQNGCKIDPQSVSDATYKKITSTQSATYKPATLFYNQYPSGQIYDHEVENSVPVEDTLSDGTTSGGLPVALDTKRGIYEYSVHINNLGEFYEYDSLGRLIGGGDGTPVINDDSFDFVADDGSVQYMCAYLVNMGELNENFDIVCDWDQCEDGDCTSNCVGPNCDIDDPCEGDDCVSNCIGAGCIYDADAGSSLLERVVSLNNLFPNGTDSYNWNRDKNTKAAETIDEIEDAGNSIYDEDPILSVTITPTTARAIQAYNDEAEKNNRGGYSNATLTCTSVGGYDMIGCYSTFIDDLIDGRISYGNRVIDSNLGDIVNDRSMIMSGNYRSSSSRYFQLWEGTISEYDMLGPSWK